MLVDRLAVNRGLHTAGRQQKSKLGSDSPADVSGTVRGGRGGGTAGRGGRGRGGRGLLAAPRFATYLHVSGTA